MELAWHDTIGTIGVALIVISYGLLQAEKISSKDPRYYLANGVGAALILLSLVVEFNLSAFVMEAFWLLISLIGVWRALKSRRRGADRA